MNSNESVGELRETSLNLRPSDLLGHWQARKVVSRDAVGVLLSWFVNHSANFHTISGFLKSYFENARSRPQTLLGDCLLPFIQPTYTVLKLANLKFSEV